MVAAAYVALGWLAIQLRLAPGYASAIWPGAGIALVATLRRPASGIAGTMLGSWVLSFAAIGTAFPWLSNLDVLAMAATIGLGNVLQAYFGAKLIRRFVVQPRLLQSGRDVLFFGLLGGLLACTVSPTIAVFAQLYSGLASADGLPLRWLTLWAASTIGVGLFAPLALLVLERREEVWRRRRRSVALPVSIAIGATAIVCVAVDHWESLRVAEAKDSRVVAMNASLYEQLERHRKSLIAMAGFFEYSDRVTPDEFEQMLLHLAKLAEQTTAGHWYARPAGAEPAGDWQLAPTFSADCVPPDSIPLELDLVGPTRVGLPAQRLPADVIRRGMAKSLRADQPVMTEPASSIDESGATHVVAALVTGIYAPRSTDNQGPESEEDRAARLRGFIAYEFDLVALANCATFDERDSLTRTVVCDMTDPTREPVTVLDAFASWSPDRPRAGEFSLGSTEPDYFRFAFASEAERPPLDEPSWVSFAGRLLAIQTGVVPETVERDLQSWTVLASGLTLSVLLTGFLLVVSGHAAQVERTVDERTGELRSANARLGRERRAVQRMNRDLKRSRDAARSAVRAKTAFIANMSHEIRTPMTAILGFTELLADPSAEPARREEFARVVRRNGEHLLAIVNDILDVSKIEAGKLRIDRVACDLAATVFDVAALMQVSAERKGLEFVVDPIPDNVPRHVVTDPTRLRQILFNLLSNAIKFTEQGSVRLSTRLLSASGEPGMPCRLEFTVVDSGIGMKPSQIDRVFRPFSQADDSTTRRYGGTGLGLTISRRLAELLGGRLTAESELGRGSTFRFELAAEISRAVAAQPVSAPVDPLADVGPDVAIGRPETSMPRLRALVVDDGDDNRALVRVYLNRLGFDIVEAIDGRAGVDEALRALRAAQPFDLILMDMQMPVMDGWEATRTLRREGVRTPIVAVTAGVLADDRAKCLRVGCDAYAAKPIDPRALREIIERLAPQNPSTRIDRVDPLRIAA